MKDEPGYILQEMQLYNWGAFGGRHCMTVDAANTAILGATGSGKTTLIDALMTLLCANPRYNLASTGGHESDRDLAAYVRGASSQGGGDEAHIARPGRSLSGIAARMVRVASGADHGGQASQSGDGDTDSDMDSDTVLLGALFWFDGSSSALSDMGRRWLFAQGPGHSLDAWLEEHHHGGARALGKLEKHSPGLRIFANKAPYLARLQSFFAVGANAFTLLNRAAGLKQLNSIDEVFRELVLEDQSAFEQAQQVAASFDQLSAIHADMERARRQLASLLPLRELDRQEQAQHQALRQLERWHAALPGWFTQHGLQLWARHLDDLKSQRQRLEQRLAQAQQALEAAEQHFDAQAALYHQSGGGSIEQIEQNIALLQQERARRQEHWRQYRQMLRNLNLPDAAERPDATALTALQHQAQPALGHLQARIQALTEQAEQAIAQAHNAAQHLQALEQEQQAVRQRPGSNLPLPYQTFRTELAAQLQRPEHELPFVAELVQVPDSEQAWRGAIERALGSQRLRILVPPQAMRAALQWVNQRHNRLHVRLLEAADAGPAPVFWADGFCRKLQLKPHASQAALRQLLHGIDRHCVADVQALHHTPHAMTQQGLMSGKAQHFDKQDHKRLQDDWMTGFDNRDRLAQLARQIEQALGQVQALRLAKDEAQAQQQQAQAQAALWQGLAALDFDSIDWPATEARLALAQQKLAALLAPDSDAAKAKARMQAAAQQRRQAGDELKALQIEEASLQAEAKRAGQQHQRYLRRQQEQGGQDGPDGPGLQDAAHGLDAAELSALAAALPGGLPEPERERLDEQERHSQAGLQQRLDQARQHSSKLRASIEKQMQKAQQENLGALADHACELDEMPHFLACLRVLEEEALPEKIAAFQDYLNSTSEQGVNALLSGIDTQVSEIEERIEQLNATLRRVDFQPGRYLQLAPQPVTHPSLQAMHAALAMLRSEKLADDDGQRHYRALRAMVELLREHASNRRTRAAQALLDARYRLQFSAQVHAREDGRLIERFTGSQGGSGGEKESITSHVLTASLSYALCPPGRSRPVFGTIVLDEAFSKSSHAVAARIIQALREFGLHALFVTPNKELRLLRQHTRSAVLVHRRGAQAMLASLSWQELDAQRTRTYPPGGGADAPLPPPP